MRSSARAHRLDACDDSFVASSTQFHAGERVNVGKNSLLFYASILKKIRSNLVLPKIPFSFLGAPRLSAR